MRTTHERTPSVGQDVIIRSIDSETEALLHSVLGGFLEIDLQFRPVLDGFTGGNVITHLSREADRMADELFEATGRPVPLIDASRQFDVDSGGMRPAAVLIEDFVESSTRLQDAMAGVQEWPKLHDGVRDLPSRRLVQLVVHHADLTRSWDAVSEEVGAVALSLLPHVMAAEIGDVRFVIRPAQAVVLRGSRDGSTEIAGDARSLLAWASGRLDDEADGVHLSSICIPRTPARRVWF